MSLLPNAAQTRIDPRKLRDYALNPAHGSGRYKAEFLAQMGYSIEDWNRLERDSGFFDQEMILQNWLSSNRPRGERECEMETNISLLDTVIATVDFLDEQVLAGDLGTIVEVYSRPTLAYEVEFINPDGSTRALLTLMPEQVRKLSDNDVITTRPLALAA